MAVSVCFTSLCRKLGSVRSKGGGASVVFALPRAEACPSAQPLLPLLRLGRFLRVLFQRQPPCRYSHDFWRRRYVGAVPSPALDDGVDREAFAPLLDPYPGRSSTTKSTAASHHRGTKDQGKESNEENKETDQGLRRWRGRLRPRRNKRRESQQDDSGSSQSGRRHHASGFETTSRRRRRRRRPRSHRDSQQDEVHPTEHHSSQQSVHGAPLRHAHTSRHSQSSYRPRHHHAAPARHIFVAPVAAQSSSMQHRKATAAGKVTAKRLTIGRRGITDHMKASSTCLLKGDGSSDHRGARQQLHSQHLLAAQSAIDVRLAAALPRPPQHQQQAGIDTPAPHPISSAAPETGQEGAAPAKPAAADDDSATTESTNRVARFLEAVSDALRRSLIGDENEYSLYGYDSAHRAVSALLTLAVERSKHENQPVITQRLLASSTAAQPVQSVPEPQVEGGPAIVSDWPSVHTAGESGQCDAFASPQDLSTSAHSPGLTIVRPLPSGSRNWQHTHAADHHAQDHPHHLHSRSRGQGQGQGHAVAAPAYAPHLSSSSYSLFAEHSIQHPQPSAEQPLISWRSQHAGSLHAPDMRWDGDVRRTSADPYRIPPHHHPPHHEHEHYQHQHYQHDQRQQQPHAHGNDGVGAPYGFTDHHHRRRLHPEHDPRHCERRHAGFGGDPPPPRQQRPRYQRPTLLDMLHTDSPPTPMHAQHSLPQHTMF
ncbi:hypothetical protein PTSG_11568 [Salpingoeca rosetta]|uniref:Uncharacterized protein n=1 Tax=Salpingoeca rosetta (strain ATCC 50818 / BSB-021) TaxID=946362 RepID=F2TVY9_SALR5|nr:uncharacterized protein PTSG_11568 [Salpingoeca rosetta]EGD72235.1 hypothetical protein PTSG_11568 [Salpingoeca rosetta]|eukprot:XP_004998806.1 hypothetical protein PTSG_11568 [Salpingoeca rosetta]